MNLLQLLRDGEIKIRDEKDPSREYILELELTVVKSEDAGEQSLLNIKLFVPDASQFNGNEEARQAKLQQLYELVNEDLIKTYNLNNGEQYLYNKEKNIFTINPKGLKALNEYAATNHQAQEIIHTILTLFRLQSRSANIAKEALKNLFQSHVIHLEFEQSVMAYKNSIYYYILDPKFGGSNKSHKLGNIILFNIKSALVTIFPQINSQLLSTKDEIKLPKKYKNTYRGISVKYQIHKDLEFPANEIPNPTLEIDSNIPGESAVASVVSNPSVPSAATNKGNAAKDKPEIVDLFADDASFDIGASKGILKPVPFSPAKAAAKVGTPQKSLFSSMVEVLPDSLKDALSESLHSRQTGDQSRVPATVVIRNSSPTIGEILESPALAEPLVSPAFNGDSSSSSAPAASTTPPVINTTDTHSRSEESSLNPDKHIPSKIPPQRDPPPVPKKKTPIALTLEQEAKRDADAKAEMELARQKIDAVPARRRVIGSFHGGQISPLTVVDASSLPSTDANAASVATSSSSSQNPNAHPKEGKPAPVNVLAGMQSAFKAPTTSGKPVAVALDENDESTNKLRRSLNAAKKAAAARKSDAERKIAEEIKQQQEAEASAKKNAGGSQLAGARPPATNSNGNNELKPPAADTSASQLPAAAPSTQNPIADAALSVVATSSSVDTTAALKAGSSELKLPPTVMSESQRPVVTPSAQVSAATVSSDHVAAQQGPSQAGVFNLSKLPAQQKSSPGDGMLPDDSPLMSNLGPTFTGQSELKVSAKLSVPDSTPYVASAPVPAVDDNATTAQFSAHSEQLSIPPTESVQQQIATSTSESQTASLSQSIAKQLAVSPVSTVGVAAIGTALIEGSPSFVQRLKPRPPASVSKLNEQQTQSLATSAPSEASSVNVNGTNPGEAKLVSASSDPLGVSGSGGSLPGSPAVNKLTGSHNGAQPTQTSVGKVQSGDDRGGRGDDNVSVSSLPFSSKSAAVEPIELKPSSAKKSGWSLFSLISSSSSANSSSADPTLNASYRVVVDEAMQNEFAHVKDYKSANDYLDKYIFTPAKVLKDRIKSSGAVEPSSEVIHFRIKQVQAVINKIASSNRTATHNPYETLCHLYVYITAPLQKEFLNVHRHGFFASLSGKEHTNHWSSFISNFQEIAYKALINESRQNREIGEQIQFLRDHYSDKFITDNAAECDDSTESLQELLDKKINELTIQERAQQPRLPQK